MLSGSSKLARSLELESTLLRKAAGAGTTAIEKHMTQKELAEEHVQGTGHWWELSLSVCMVSSA